MFSDLLRFSTCDNCERETTVAASPIKNYQRGTIVMWYIVLSHSLPEKEESQQLNYEEHRQWLDDQHRAGRLLFSGPTSDRAYGVYIMLAADLSEAKRIAGEDPHHQRGIRTMEVMEWSVRRAFRLDRTVADVEHLAKGE